MRFGSALLALLLVVVCAGESPLAQGPSAGDVVTAGATTGLRPTAHDPLPANPELFWIVPDAGASRRVTADDPMAQLARGSRLIAQGDHAAGLPLVRDPRLATIPLAVYARYYEALALVGLDRSDEADSVLLALEKRNLTGPLREAVLLQRAEIATLQTRFADARLALETLARINPSHPEEAFLRLGQAAESAGDHEGALSAFRRVYYEFALTPQAEEAGASIARLETTASASPGRVAQDLARAERLFNGRRWTAAREAFAALTATVADGDRGLVQLRIAECDHHLGRHRAARDALRPFLAGGPYEAEARYFHLSAIRGLRDYDTYVALVQRFVGDQIGPWVEEALNDLGSHYIVVDDDVAADGVFRELLARFPGGRFGGRAAWKVGWFSYRRGAFADAADVFERAAATWPRADYRPAWLYWSGRARDQVNDQVTANARYRLVVADYQNSYYGRLASAILDMRRESPVAPTLVSDRVLAADATRRPNDPLIRALIAADMFDDALREVQHAQRAWGDSSVLQATAAYVRRQQATQLKETERFNALRGAITQMRRAYPQFMAAGGEHLPPGVLEVIFPLDYWPLIQKYANTHRLDAFLIAALMAQESTFTAEIRSAANAYGLMQIIPATGRRYATKLGIRPFSTASLRDPETNVRIGTQYFKDLMERFGSPHYALASYNAGESRVARWIKENPDLPEDEFVDSIPFVETQGYVKRILGTAEDYRRLYGGGILRAAGAADPTASRTD